ncbi:SAM-dependent methyltransferase [Alphaproteobacteria bacterium KMM 3653]|uniref:SAM-dependent methyltransferase n=1 Tax=Harenicola maris TaxID=2841044 RepID=A0AAP2CS06_9RHOB|nr:SAM-dependent methyltransferase [Harenicola maris]
MTPLGQLLLSRIAMTGPMTVADYMTECLLHPEHGYYTSREPFGTAGDFITAPEISQMFGEMIGLCFAQAWRDQGSPKHFVLAELGPGRGTLLLDALRAGRAVPGFIEAAQIVLVEASERLREVQAQALSGHKVQWVEHLQALPEGPLFLIANEFFDALPIRQFQRETAGWSERMVGAEEGKLIFGLGPKTAMADLTDRLADTSEGQIIETCAQAPALMRLIAERITAQGGAALVIDYGDAPSRGDTLQAMRGHAYADPLAEPGRADLTAHVDFAPLITAAEAMGARVSPLTPQGVMLERLGITQRAQALAARLSNTALTTHIAAHRRLTHPEEMGSLFKAIAVTPPAAPLLAGFSPMASE